MPAYTQSADVPPPCCATAPDAVRCPTRDSTGMMGRPSADDRAGDFGQFRPPKGETPVSAGDAQFQQDGRGLAEAFAHALEDVAKQETWDLLAEDQAFEDHMRKLEEIDWGKALSEGGHLGLDILGLIPGLGEPADLVNCLWYFGEGKKMDAGLSCAAIVPVAGWLATAGKGGKWVTKADGFFKKLFSENPAFTVCALPKSLSGTSARAGLRACPVEFENFGNEAFGSPAGLIYQRMTNGKHHIDHVMDHTRPGPPGKPRHGIFKQKDERKLLRFVDDAWKKRDKKTSIVAPNGDTAWPVEYGGVIGENGETFVCVVTRHSKKKFRVITAYPSPDATCPRN
nr:hypothetical protein OG499_10015 [Streptomyces anulatus]